MTTDDLARLRSLAEAATPGPWESVVLPSRDTGCSGHQHAADVFGHRYVRTGDGGYPGADLSGRRAEADAAFIAAIDPQTVLALLDAAALGLAWSRVEAALPEGWRVGEVKNVAYRGVTESWLVMAWEFGDPDYRIFESSYGPTPIAALLALAEKLEARNA